ncbi:MAG: gas vesicle protein [Acetobacteraceae bacterium]|nr:gas vesicle protein [Acetobacteraceae bacterium]
MSLRPIRDRSTLADLIDKLLDKGLVINADIAVSVAGVELLGVKLRAALASFETAARYGLEFPSGTNLQTAAWKEATVAKEACPQCEKVVATELLLGEGCPWCGWQSARRQSLVASAPPAPLSSPPFAGGLVPGGGRVK